MKHSYHDIIKPFLRDKILREVINQNLTEEQASEILKIATRSFTNIKSGKYMVCAESLLIFMTDMCSDTEAFIDEARKLIASSESTPD